VVWLLVALYHLHYPHAPLTGRLLLLSLLLLSLSLLLLLHQAWEGACGVLDQYGMKLTRMFANLCNVGVQPQQLHTTLTAGPCTAAGRR